MYVSDANTNAINIFRLDDGRQIGSIAYPMAPDGKRFALGAGIATDSANNLWASFTYDPGGAKYPGKVVVFGYAPGALHWFTKIAAGCCGSPNIAVSNRGEIAEALGFFPPCCGGGVGFIEPGKKYIGHYNLALDGAEYDAYDSAGTLWIAGVNEGFKPVFGFIRRGSNVFNQVHLKPTPSTGPMAVDAANDVLIDNDGIVYAFNERADQIYRVELSGAVSVTGITLSKDRTLLYVAEMTGKVLAYRFPLGGMPVAEYGVGGTPKAITLGSI